MEENISIYHFQSEGDLRKIFTATTQHPFLPHDFPLVTCLLTPKRFPLAPLPCTSILYLSLPVPCGMVPERKVGIRLLAIVQIPYMVLQASPPGFCLLPPPACGGGGLGLNRRERPKSQTSHLVCKEGGSENTQRDSLMLYGTFFFLMSSLICMLYAPLTLYIITLWGCKTFLLNFSM